MKCKSLWLPALMALAYGQVADARVSFDVHSTVWGGQIAPHSPEVAGMAVYGDETPDLYRGTVSVDIPLFTWDDNLFNIPFSLSYASSGYKPGIACSGEGLGWALVAGGTITRDVVGIPDEHYSTYYQASGQFYANPSGRDDPLSSYIFRNSNDRHEPDPYGGCCIRGYASRYAGTSVLSDTRYIYTGILGEEFIAGSPTSATGDVLIENEPDIFHFNLPGMRGSFILMPGHSVRFLDCDVPAGGLSVDFDISLSAGGTGSSFTLTDGLGVKYVFADIETTTSVDVINGTDEGGTAISAWRLSRIMHPSGKTVTFTYEDSTQTNRSASATCDHLRISDGGGPGSGSFDYCQWTDPDAYHDNSLIVNTVLSRRLKSVNFAGRGSATLDWTSAGRLERIVFRNASSRVLKDCQLTYYVPLGTSGSRHADLAFLTELSLSGEGCYHFEYDSADDGHRFPSNYSGNSSGDLWHADRSGYYCSASLLGLYSSNSQSLTDLSSAITSGLVPDLARTRMGMLTSMTYPTGGRTEFTYEQNTYSRLHDPGQAPSSQPAAACGLRVARLDTFDSDGRQIQCRKFGYEDGGGHSSGILLDSPVLYYKYEVTSNTPGVSLKLHREAVSTTSGIGCPVEQAIEYTRVVESVSETALSATLARTVHEFAPSSTVFDTGLSLMSLAEADDDQTEFSLVNLGTTLDEWQNSGRSLLAGKVLRTEECSIAAGDPRSVHRYGYDLVHDISGADLSAKTLRFGHLCDRVYRTASPVTKSAVDSLTDRVGTVAVMGRSFSWDLMGRPVSEETEDSQGRSLITSRAYHSSVPWLITSESVSRGGFPVSAVQYTYSCLDSSTHWFAPHELRTGVISGGAISQYRTVRTFGNYDSWGNPCLVSDAAGRNDVWTWTQDGLHPASCSRAESGHRTETTSWTWIPMVGVTSETGPDGRTMTWDFDQYGRLSSATGPDGAIISTHEYHIPSAGGTTAYSDRPHIVSTAFRSASSSSTDIVYFDGLGREVQQVEAGVQQGLDLVRMKSYDPFGRCSSEFLPFPAAPSCGLYRTSGLEDWYEESGLAGGDDMSYLETAFEYEGGGSDRIVSVSQPGYSYSDAPSMISYTFSDGSDIRLAAGRYSAVKTVDGDGVERTEWKDREDRVVRVDTRLEGGGVSSVHMTYDDRGNLLSVTSSGAGASVSYAYDGLNRMISRTMAGAQPVYFVYDSADRVVMFQDGVRRQRGEWILNSYDAFDCLTDRHIVTTSMTREQLQARFPFSGTGGLLETDVSERTLLEHHLYDGTGLYPYIVLRLVPLNPDIPVQEPVPAYLSFEEVPSWGPGQTSPARLTGAGSSLNRLCYSKVAELPADGSLDGIEYAERAYYYDKCGMIMQVVERSTSGGLCRLSRSYDRQGNVLLQEESCSAAASSDTYVKRQAFSYDGRGRLSSESTSVGPAGGQAASATVSYAYNALGKLSGRTVSGDCTVSETFGYTLQGFLAEHGARHLGSTSDDLFHISSRYDAPTLQGARPSFAGRVSQVTWKHGALPDRSYVFSYDNAGRLKDSRLWMAGTVSDAFSERGMTYDDAGNLLTIRRFGESSTVPVDDFAFNYGGNLLQSVTSGQSTYQYTYDDNGNLVSDGRRSVSMTYNLLDLPSRVSDTVTGDFSERTYLYDGTKTAVYCGEEGHVYAGSMVFRHGDGYEFESTTFGGGRIVGDGGALTPMCHITDGNGSTRCIVDLSDGDAVERDDYYPFGARVDDLLPKLVSNRYRFSGKEDETGPGEGMVDFGHRIYDPETARWTARDPLADKYPGYSPYSFCLDDPINHVDPQGDTVAVIYSNGFFGHLAILIQGDDNLYHLYSKNGFKNGSSSFFNKLWNSSSGSQNQIDDIAFESVEHFIITLEGNMDKETASDIDDNNGKDRYNHKYTKAAVICTTAEQDGDIREAMEFNISLPYNLFLSNCSHAVMKSLLSQGIIPYHFFHFLPSIGYRTALNKASRQVINQK